MLFILYIKLCHIPERERDALFPWSGIVCGETVLCVLPSCWWLFVVVTEEAVVEVDELLSNCNGGIAFKFIFVLSDVIDLCEEVDVDRLAYRYLLHNKYEWQFSLFFFFLLYYYPNLSSWWWWNWSEYSRNSIIIYII